jgi:hypothetical protein
MEDTSYVTEWASSERSSRVTTPFRTPSDWRRLVTIRHDADREIRGRDAPTGSAHLARVLLEPSGRHAVRVFDGAIDCFDRTGALTWRCPGVVDSSVFALDGVLLAGRVAPRDYDGNEPAAAGWLPEEGRVWALHHDGPVFTALAQLPLRGYGENTRNPRFEYTRVAATASGWHFTARWWLENTTARGAIRHDGTAVIATDAARLLVLGPDLDGGTPRVHADVPIDFVADDLSVTGEGVCLVRVHDGRTEARFVDLSGRARWSAEVPFAVAQPPVDGGDGRIYLVGRGIAAVDGGQMAWLYSSKAAQAATAFGDGALAITSASELRLVARDGGIRAAFRTDKDEVIVTPPAIASDGTVWVGTEDAIYVAQ